MENSLNQIKISVIIPSFNQAEYIEETLLSVIKQNYRWLELIVIDGGSTDGSVEIIRKYESFISYWISEPDGGQTKALIKGFNKSTGDILCWLNSDDLHEPNTLHEVATYFDNHTEIDMVYGNSLWIDFEGKPLRYQREIPFNRFLWLYTYNYIPGMSAFWRRTIYDQVGGLDPNFDLAMDADLWSRFAEVGRLAHEPKVWSQMRFYPEQKNQKLRHLSNIEDQIIRSRIWGAERPLLYAQKKIIAQSLRIAWKLVSGCYTINYKRYLER